MNEELENMDDLFDEGVGKSLKQLGATFPEGASDFKRIIKIAEQSAKGFIPEKLKDPYRFLGQKSFKCESFNYSTENQEYFSGMAQAAREGKSIPDYIKAKMEDDRTNSNKLKKD